MINVMTETEARGVRCCGPLGCGHAVTDDPHGARFYIGSACMAWRWGHWDSDNYPESDPPGVCGLAGNP